jgi:hypothetical protein
LMKDYLEFHVITPLAPSKAHQLTYA